MTFSKRALLPAAAALLLAASTVHAGVLVNTLTASDPSTSNTFWWGYPANATDVSSVQLHANISTASDAPEGYDIGGSLSADPHIEIIERITNSSATTWTSYTVDVIPDSNSTISNLVALFPGPPDQGLTSNFTTAATSGTPSDSRLTFSGGTVAAGQTVFLDFAYDISLINNSFPGNFSYSIVNAPAPEPTTLTVLSAGALLLLKRRRTA